MAVRLQEIHPSIVHYPIALIPTAVGADLLANLTGSERLAEVGRLLMPVAAASAAVSAFFGIVAQEEVNAEGKAGEILATHRNMNLALTALGTVMAAWRWRRSEATPGYLALGLAGIGALGYSAYLGGKMVYEHGVGVKPADGLRYGDSPELAPGEFREAVRRTVEDVQIGVPRAIDEMREGRIAPSFAADLENPTAAPPTGRSVEGSGPAELAL